MPRNKRDVSNGHRDLGRKLIEEYARAAGYTSGEHFLLSEFNMTPTTPLYGDFSAVIEVLFTDLSRRMARIEHALNLKRL